MSGEYGRLKQVKDGYNIIQNLKEVLFTIKKESNNFITCRLSSEIVSLAKEHNKEIDKLFKENEIHSTHLKKINSGRNENDYLYHLIDGVHWNYKEHLEENKLLSKYKIPYIEMSYYISGEIDLYKELVKSGKYQQEKELINNTKGE